MLRAEPHEAAAAQVDVGRERRGVTRADAAVETVGRDHDVGGELARGGDVVGDVVLEDELDAERLAARLQDIEQPLAPDAAEAMAARRDRAALEMDVDVVPVVERVGDRRAAVSGSAAARLPSVWSENTTPQPNVSYGRLRSTTRTSWRGSAFLSSRAR